MSTTTHDFSLESSGFQPTSVSAGGGDKVKVTNNLTKDVRIDFPSCFVDTSSHVLIPYDSVTRTMVSNVTQGTYQLGAHDPEAVVEPGDELPVISTGEIDVSS